ncbi:hypothetical protein Tcan_13885 [Toxocara canis]|uniref:Uncharacterized protein n=1 Tax=Toxocara canis TaxID=6265 RepID=A0A0B2V4J4_TOXCA|nr:hypothetical protein Tcan_13885 [Toxocara canis]
MESKKESAQEGALLRSPKQTSDEGWAAATGLLSKKAMASPISGVSESSKLSRSKSILTEEAPIKNKKKSGSVCEEPVSRAVEQLSNLLVHSLDDDEFRNMLSIASKPRYGAINNTFDHESGTVNDDTRDEVEDIQERNKISVTTGLILHQIQRIAEEKQRKEDIG